MTILMPKATALWLIENTALSFVQIGAFVGLHELEIQRLADSEGKMQMENPVQSGLLSEAEIERCVQDPTARLQVDSQYQKLAQNKPKNKGRRYTPLLKRANKPNAIAWLVREYPEMNDSQIGRLVGSTKPTIVAIRNRTYWNMSNVAPASPVELGLCTLNEMQKVIDLALELRRQKRLEVEALQGEATPSESAENAEDDHEDPFQQAREEANNLFA